MIALDEDALLCDFAEVYHIYDIYKMNPEYIATLAKGLKNDSRIMMAISGLRVDVQTLLLAHIADSTAINTWFHSEDAQKNQNRPKSMIELLTGQNEQKFGFDSGAEFDEKWRAMTSE